MSEDQAIYNSQPAAIIESPRTVLALSEGLVDYKVWGWVKISAKFIAHIKRLKGAKLAVWQTMALSINEYGECELSAKELAEMTGYSRSEIIESQKELDEMGYLTVTKSNGKKNIYKPEFAARGENAPTSEPVQKNDQSRKTTSPVTPLETANDQSSPSEGNSDPSFNRVKRVNTAYHFENKPDMIAEWLKMASFPGAKQATRIDAILSYLGETLRRNTETKEWKEFAKYIDSERQLKGWDVSVFVDWMKSQKNYDPVFWSCKKMRECYPMAFEEREEKRLPKPL